MPASITDLTFRCALITETLGNAPASWKGAVQNAGFSAETLSGAQSTLVKTLTALSKVSHHADDHTATEQGRRAVTELDEWQEVTGRLWSKILNPSREQWGKVLGEDLEGHDELFVVLMRCLRTITVVRNTTLADNIRAGGRRVDDDLQRGSVLLKKAIKSVNKTFYLRPDEVRHHVSRATLEGYRSELEAFYDTFSAAAHEGLDGGTMAWFGIASNNARPIGGAAYSVILHERAQRDAPVGEQAPPCPGWGVGAGGNRENYWQHES